MDEDHFMDQDHFNQLPEPVKKELFHALYEKVSRLCPDRAGLISMCILSFSLKRVLLCIGDKIVLRGVTEDLEAFCEITWPDTTDADVVNDALEREQPDLVRLIKKLEIDDASGQKPLLETLYESTRTGMQNSTERHSETAKLMRKLSRDQHENLKEHYVFSMKILKRVQRVLKRNNLAPSLHTELNGVIRQALQEHSDDLRKEYQSPLVAMSRVLWKLAENLEEIADWKEVERGLAVLLRKEDEVLEKE
ncbi:hypothetical protein IQ07DRAFT_600724 [Pyrenochaeta sp. DS3sAY3a]|nr:hypothetical protein IQ07DRAFT_600724 [Pyrenochaeta sp. DS3sAY3a]